MNIKVRHNQWNQTSWQDLRKLNSYHAVICYNVIVSGGDNQLFYVNLREFDKSCILNSRIRQAKGKFCTIYLSILSKPEVMQEVDKLHEEYVLISADKACNGIIFVMLNITIVRRTWL